MMAGRVDTNALRKPQAGANLSSVTSIARSALLLHAPRPSSWQSRTLFRRCAGAVCFAGAPLHKHFLLLILLHQKLLGVCKGEPRVFPAQCCET